MQDHNCAFTAEDLEGLITSYIADLSEFETNEIARAFTQWRKEEKGLPESADIRRLIFDHRNAFRASSNPEHIPFENKNLTPKYEELSEEGQRLFDDCMAQAKAYLKAGVIS